MPCYDGGSEAYHIEKQKTERLMLIKEINKLESLLCQACALLQNSKVELPKNLNAWKALHDEVDNHRKQKAKLDKEAREEFLKNLINEAADELDKLEELD